MAHQHSIGHSCYTTNKHRRMTDRQTDIQTDRHIRSRWGTLRDMMEWTTALPSRIISRNLAFGNMRDNSTIDLSAKGSLLQRRGAGSPCFAITWQYRSAQYIPITTVIQATNKMNQQINQTINTTINESANKPISQSTNHPFRLLPLSQSINHSEWVSE